MVRSCILLCKFLRSARGRYVIDRRYRQGYSINRFPSTVCRAADLPMAEGVEVEGSDVDRDFDVLLAFAPSLTINQASHLQAQLRPRAAVLDSITIYWGGVYDVDGIIHHRRGAFGLGGFDEGGAVRISVEEAGEEAARDGHAIGAYKRAAHIGHGFPRGDALQDARPATLGADLFEDMAFDGLGGHERQDRTYACLGQAHPTRTHTRLTSLGAPERVLPQPTHIARRHPQGSQRQLQHRVRIGALRMPLRDPLARRRDYQHATGQIGREGSHLALPRGIH